jgi:hypothetical protein
MVNVCTIFTNDLYPNNWAFECLTSLLNTFPWISSVCWDKWLIFLFSLIYLVYLKHVRIVYTCMCVLLSHVYKLWVILKYACSSNQVNIYACVSYKGGRLQLFIFFFFLYKLVKGIYRMFIIWYKKIKIKVNHIVAGVYLFTQAYIYVTYDR